MAQYSPGPKDYPLLLAGSKFPYAIPITPSRVLVPCHPNTPYSTIFSGLDKLSVLYKFIFFIAWINFLEAGHKLPLIKLEFILNVFVCKVFGVPTYSNANYNALS